MDTTEVKRYDGTFPEVYEGPMEDSDEEYEVATEHLVPGQHWQPCDPSKWKPWNPDKWQEEMQSHPLLRTEPINETEELPPLFEALQVLKYDTEENSAEDVAEAYKTDGNENFRRKNYHWAVANYTKALEVKCHNSILNAQLYANRAAAQYRCGNYKKALLDAEESKKLKPDHFKALKRGAMCCFELYEYADCIAWCDEGLKVEPDDKDLVALKKKAEEKKKIADRNKRNALKEEAKKMKELVEVKKAIQKKGIRTAEKNIAKCQTPLHPLDEQSKTQRVNAGSLVWPVIFMYPEYGTTDYVKEFSEDSRFEDHLDEMFDPANPPEWDARREYVPENLQLYFSHEDDLVPFEKTKMLDEILSHPKYIVHDLTPCFIVTVQGSDFDKMYRKRHTVVSF